MRTGTIERNTKETQIKLTLNLDGTGKSECKSGIPFFDHMLTLFAKHSKINLICECNGDREVDDHHTVEDIGIALGTAFCEAIGDKRGIARYAHAYLPMDETLMLVAVDVSGRPFFCYDVSFDNKYTGTFDACLMQEFLRAFAFAAKITLHVKMLYGENTHHILEAIAKGLAISIKQAVKVDPNEEEIPSTKGIL